MKNLLLLISLLWVALVSAQDFVIENVTLFDGEALQEQTSVRVANGKIAEVGQNIEWTGQRIDGNGKFLMPAMTNSHVHAFMAGNLKQAASAGVLNLLDMHGMELYQRTMQESFKDSTNYANFYYAGSAATAPEGHGTQFGFPSPTLTTSEEAEAFVSARIDAGATYLKIIVEPWKNTITHEVAKSLIDEAHKNNIPAVVHISNVEDAYQVLNNKADGLVHVWWDKKLSNSRLTKLTKTTNFFVIPTLLTTQTMLNLIRKAEPNRAILTDTELKEEIFRLYQAGVPILAGTDPPNANINYGTDLYKELQLLSEAGIPNIDVLKSATSLPANHFRLKESGFIKEGYKADLILLNSNPIDDMQHISDIDTIWKHGKKVGE